MIEVLGARVAEDSEIAAQVGGQTLVDHAGELARVDPEQFAVALCTIDGQRFALGDSKVDFSIQACSKPINYCLALEEHGEEYVHGYVGREPSGRRVNEMVLTGAGLPHNPLINAGAIMCTALIRQDLNPSDQFDHIMSMWTALAGGAKPGFNNAVFLSERKSSDRNFALAYMMRERKVFPEGTDLIAALELYLQSSAIELDAEMMAVVAATLANGGVCPINDERILQPKTVRNCLSLMYSCGMNELSGEFAFLIGLPAKSGEGGALLLIIPNVMGICVWSPRLGPSGNSVRGVEFCKRLIHSFNFHNYDNLTGLTEKTDPRVDRIQTQSDKFSELMWAASKGDISAIQRLVVEGADLDGADYDGRTPLHLAAAEGRIGVVQYLIGQKVDVNPRDRWGGTPLDDANTNFREDVIEFLQAHGALHYHSKENFTWLGGLDDESKAVSLQVDSDRIAQVIWAASRGVLGAIQRLVARGVDLNGSDYDGRTPLHLAAAQGHEHLVQFFINHKLYLNPRDRWGNTPLEDAVRHGHTAIASLLEKHGARR